MDLVVFLKFVAVIKNDEAFVNILNPSGETQESRLDALERIFHRFGRGAPQFILVVTFFLEVSNDFIADLVKVFGESQVNGKNTCTKHVSVLDVFDDLLHLPGFADAYLSKNVQESILFFKHLR